MGDAAVRPRHLHYLSRQSQNCTSCCLGGTDIASGAGLALVGNPESRDAMLPHATDASSGLFQGTAHHCSKVTSLRGVSGAENDLLHLPAWLAKDSHAPELPNEQL